MNVFTGWTQAQLESALADVQQEIATGTTIVKTDADGVSVEMNYNMSPQARMRLILKALHRLDPVTYPARDVRRYNRVQARIR